MSPKSHGASIRRAWRCSCDGASHRFPGREAHAAVEVNRISLRQAAGVEDMQTCPWQALRHPVVAEVLAHVRMCASGFGMSPSAIIPLNPPHRIWDGVLTYANAVSMVESHDDRVRRRDERRRGRKERSQ